MVCQKFSGLLHQRSLVACVRSISLCRSLTSADKEKLSQLRKKTGYPFINCRKALIQFDNDIDKAEEWLVSEAQKQGWAKATKLEGRAMSQGLVGLVVDKNMGAMAEVTCETDFVARNLNFQQLVKTVTQTCFNTGQSVGASKVYFGQNEVNQLRTVDSTSVADLVALQVGNLGENMQARRGVYFKAPETYSLASYVHKAGISVDKDESLCELGKYAALLSFRQVLEPHDDDEQTLPELGMKLCQHIVGMNPESVGSEDDEASTNADEEARLIHQEFLLDSSIKVHEFLQENGLEVNGWVRFECGGDL